MSKEYPFFNDEGKDITYRVVTGAVRVAPIKSCKVRDSGKKEEQLVGFYVLNGEHRDDAVEVPVGKQIFRSGLDISHIDRLDKMRCEFIGSEVREI
jgi:hypothetical protein